MSIIGSVRRALGVVAFGFALGAALAEAAIVVSPRPAYAQEQKADDSGSQDIDALLSRAQSDIENKDYAAAADKYEAYLAKRPQDAQIHFQLGYAYTALQKMDDARAEYRKATELDPKMGAAFLNLGLTELNSDPAAAIAPFEKAAELMPGEARPRLLLATALAHSGKTDEAIAQYQAAEKLDASDFEVHIGLAQTLLAKNRAVEAEREFRAAIALNGQDAQGHLGLGECLLAEKKYADAANELTAYLDAHPDDQKTRLAFISALIDAGKYDAALAELDRRDTATQDSLPILKLRFDALEGEKRYDEALATLNKAEALAPQDADIHSKLGRMDLDKKDYVHAAQEFLAALKLQPENGDALAALVNAEYLAKDYGYALKAIDLLSQRAPLSASTLFVRADCYDKLGKKPEALDAYDKFLAANTDRNSDMYFAATERARDLRREMGKNHK
jgi:tetratricopeptide (TPR) repeat protein